MFYLFFTLILLLMTFWAGRECYKNNRIESFFMIPLIVFVFFVYYLIIYLETCEGIVIEGVYRKIASMIQNLLFPLCYLYMCQQVHLKKFSPTAVVLFGMILYNLVSNTTIFLDNVPVADINSGMGVYFYKNGKEYFFMNTYELVETLQLIWIVVRTTILFQILKKKGLKATKSGIWLEIAIYFLLIFNIVTTFIPDSWWAMRYINETYICLHLAFGIFCLYIIGKGIIQDIVVDGNNEVAYIETKPKYDKVKVNFEKLVLEPRLYLKPDITVEKIYRIVGTNRTYMQEMMSQLYGETLTSYLNKLRIEEAKKLLQHEDNYKMEVIAELCGFAAPSTFTKAFKKETGVTPHLWRPE